MLTSYRAEALYVLLSDRSPRFPAGLRLPVCSWQLGHRFEALSRQGPSCRLLETSEHSGNIAQSDFATFAGDLEYLRALGECL